MECWVGLAGGDRVRVEGDVAEVTARVEEALGSPDDGADIAMEAAHDYGMFFPRHVTHIYPARVDR